MKTNRMYHEFAHLWCLFSHPSHYKKEASFWKESLQKRLGSDKKHKLLELGVGGGNNLSHLTPYFDATAVDISPSMLDNSKKLNPSVRHLVGDMRTFEIDEIFDAVIIHDAISYMTTLRDLSKTFGVAWKHLRPGGVFMTSPDYVTETFVDCDIGKHRSENEEITLCYSEFFHKIKDSMYEYLFTYYIKNKKSGRLSIEHDRHYCGLFSKASWIDALKSVGFSVELDEYPVHDDCRQSWLFVGVKPS